MVNSRVVFLFGLLEQWMDKQFEPATGPNLSRYLFLALFLRANKQQQQNPQPGLEQQHLQIAKAGRQGGEKGQCQGEQTGPYGWPEIYCWLSFSENKQEENNIYQDISFWLSFLEQLNNNNKIRKRD